MRILALCERIDGKSGYATYARDLIEGMKKRGHEVEICTMDSDECGLHLPKPIHMITRPWNAFFLARALARKCNEWNPDIIQITVEPYALMTVLLPRDLQRKIVLNVHGSYSVRILQYWQTRWLALKMYDVIPATLSLSNYTRETVAKEVEKWGSKRCAEKFVERTTVVYPAVTLPSHIPPAPERSEKLIICVGEVKPRKGILEAIGGCAVYKEKYDTPFHFLVVGKVKEEAEYTKEVRSLISKNHLDDVVTLTGPVSAEKLQEYYSGADLYLMPAKTTETTFEGFGIVFLEANAYGIPCIGPQTSGAAEAILEGETGFHTDPQNADEMAEKMHRILDEHAIAPEKCKAWAEKLSIDAKVQKIEEIYHHLASSDQ